MIWQEKRITVGGNRKRRVMRRMEGWERSDGRSEGNYPSTGQAGERVGFSGRVLIMAMIAASASLDA
jgi:hypothetical protein